MLAAGQGGGEIEQEQHRDHERGEECPITNGFHKSPLVDRGQLGNQGLPQTTGKR
jgi:hypothetical protein